MASEEQPRTILYHFRDLDEPRMYRTKRHNPLDIVAVTVCAVICGADNWVYVEATRDHWGTENSLHWVLDMAFDEDESRVRTGNASQNLAVIRHMASNLLRNEKSVKVGIEAKRKMAG